MSNVIADMSMSLDGFIAGPNDDVDQLHQWLYDLPSWRERHGLAGGTASQDAELFDEAWAHNGAILMGRRMFELGLEPWGDNPPFHMPVFVVTHRAREPLVKQGGTTFTFVTDGVSAALKQAQAAAGNQDVAVAGGAQIIQQLMRAWLLDEIEIHLVPVLLGAGRRLFEDGTADLIELERTRVAGSADVTHLRFRVVK